MGLLLLTLNNVREVHDQKLEHTNVLTISNRMLVHRLEDGIMIRGLRHRPGSSLSCRRSGSRRDSRWCSSTPNSWLLLLFQHRGLRLLLESPCTNTGGMSAYSPAPILIPDLQLTVVTTIIVPNIKAMAAEGCKYVGILYAGLMIEKKSGLPKLIEYNVRFGDLECQVLMFRLESDLAQVLLAACKGELRKVSLNWSHGFAMVAVMASKGYPGAYEKESI